MHLILIMTGLLSLNLAYNYLQKRLADTVPATRITMHIFGVSLFLAIGFHIIRRSGIILHPLSPMIALIAAGNGLAAWLFIHAVRIHMTKSILIIPLATLVSVTLIAIVLGEWHLLDPRTAQGLTLSFGGLLGFTAMWLFGSGLPNRAEAKKNSRWVLYVSAAVVLWGITNFLLKFFSNQAIPTDMFLLPWYAGALIGQSFLWFVTRRKSSASVAIPAIPSASAWITPALIALGMLTIGSLGLFYYALSLGPGIVILSSEELLKLCGGMVLGLVVFNERKNLQRRDIIGLVCGFASILLLIGSNALAS